MLKTDHIQTTHNAAIRCRLNLKPDVNKRRIFVGILNQVHRNKDLIQRWQQDHNALIVDVHTIDHQPRISLDHVHCEIHEQKLNHWLDQVITFSGKVVAYQSYYHDQLETRYGLTDFKLESKNKAALQTLDKLYQYKATTYQLSVINQIKRDLTKYYPDRKKLTNHDTIKKLLNNPALYGRTNQLLQIMDRLNRGPHQLNLDQLQLFCKTTNHDRMKIHAESMNQLQNQIHTDQAEITRLKTELKHQHKHFQTQLKHQTILLNERFQKISFWQLIYAYWQFRFQQIRQRHHKVNQKLTTLKIDEAQSQIDDKKLRQLQKKFNHHT